MSFGCNGDHVVGDGPLGEHSCGVPSVLRFTRGPGWACGFGRVGTKTEVGLDRIRTNISPQSGPAVRGIFGTSPGPKLTGVSKVRTELRTGTPDQSPPARKLLRTN